MVNVQLIENAEQAVQHDYPTVYGIDGGGVVVKNTPKTYKIRYTTTDGNIVSLDDLETKFGISYEYTLLSNTYKNGIGIMEFEQPIEELGLKLTPTGNAITQAFPFFSYVLYVKEFDYIRAVNGCKTLLTIEIPNSVTSIGRYAFNRCSNLTSITIPNSVTSIGNSAFQLCNSLTNVTIGNSVTSIGDGAFEKCSSLTSVTIPDSVTRINDETFAYCSGLTNVILGKSVTYIGFYAFSNCSNLTSITIPKSLNIWYGYSFVNCSNLINIVYDGTIEEFKNIHRYNYWRSGIPTTCIVHCTDGDIPITDLSN